MPDPQLDEPESTPAPAALETGWARPALKDADRWAITGVVLAVALVLDFVLPAAFHRHDWLAIAFLGCYIGQVNLVATWAVLAPGNIVLRLPWALLLGMMMWYAVVLGGRASGSGMASGEAMLLGIVLLSGILVAQIPLWIAKRSFRWRLARGREGLAASVQDDRQFHLQHLLVGTLLLALALSPLRLVLPPGKLEGIPWENRLLLLFVAVVVCNLLITVPCIWGALVISIRVGLAVFAWLAYGSVVTFGELLALTLFVGNPGPNERFYFWLMNVTQCLTVFGTLRIFRALGYRLVRVSSGSAPAGQVG